jgi:hypothetical protein
MVSEPREISKLHWKVLNVDLLKNLLLRDKESRMKKLVRESPLMRLPSPGIGPGFHENRSWRDNKAVVTGLEGS